MAATPPFPVIDRTRKEANATVRVATSAHEEPLPHYRVAMYMLRLSVHADRRRTALDARCKAKVPPFNTCVFNSHVPTRARIVVRASKDRGGATSARAKPGERAKADTDIATARSFRAVDRDRGRVPRGQPLHAAETAIQVSGP